MDILPGHAPVITWTPLLMVPYSHDLWTPYFRWVGRVRVPFLDFPLSAGVRSGIMLPQTGLYFYNTLSSASKVLKLCLNFQ